ncbi:hypothetical protein MMC25_000008 [Agyrium rufum]|nr:hypothetical protein [Agyrium rufum]
MSPNPNPNPTTSPQKRTWQETASLAQSHRAASLAGIKLSLPNLPDRPIDSSESETAPPLPLDVSDIPRQLLTAEEVRITESVPEVLLGELSRGERKAMEVVAAFLRRAGCATGLTNCVTEILPSQAYERAAYLDDYYAKHKAPAGPLHGLPISVKEHIGMKGLRLNAGFVAWWDQVAQEDAHILKILWAAGAVFYVRTTQPQTLMHLETSSNLYGVTVNPFNRNLTSGGSSGGEGALLGMRGSCLGIGTDIGGSIRSPAANCGLYGFRPSSYRLPVDGWDATMLNQEQIVAVIGPLSTSLAGINIFMKTIIAAKPWLTEPSLLPLPWQDNVEHFPKTSAGFKKLKIGVLWHDDIVKPHPPITAALQDVSTKLKAIEGIEVVDWKSYKHDEAWEIISSLYFCDGAAEEKEAIAASGEPWRPLSNFIITDNPHVKHHTIEDVWYWTGRRETYRRAYAKHWNETATKKNAGGTDASMAEVSEDGVVDVILCPVGPGAAPALDHAR